MQQKIIGMHNSFSMGQTDSEQNKTNIHQWEYLLCQDKIALTKKKGKAAMRKNRRNNTKKERIIMIASSAFVLSALTMTGIYMKSNNTEKQDDGYMIDFTALEDNAEEKFQEIADNQGTEVDNHADTGNSVDDLINNITEDIDSLKDDLDYIPMEAGSGLVTIPGLTDGISEEVTNANEVKENEMEKPAKDTDSTVSPAPSPAPSPVPEAKTEPETQPETEQRAESAEEREVISRTLHFAESDGLLRPVSGEVLIPFSMDSSVYFSTLDQFKYNSALMIGAAVGDTVSACAEGRVIDIFQDSEIGHAITMELGDGYKITYGQLENINVTLNSYVDRGQAIATVAAPTKYYSVEGSNLYLKLTADGTPVNPEALFR